MAQVTPNLNLTVWNLSSDTYNHEELANNFIAIDQHDHSGGGKGAQLDGSVAIKDGSITNAKLGAGIISSGNIGNVIAAGAINSTQIADYAITTTEIADGAVTTLKIADGAVGTAKLVTNSVTSTILSNYASDTFDSSRAVTSDHIRNSAVTSNKLANSAVTSNKIQNYAVTREIGANKIGGIPLYTATGTRTNYLPTGASTGDEIYFQAASHVIWHLRYNENGAVWEYIGGPPLDAVDTTNRPTDGSISAGHYPLENTWYHRWPSTSAYFNHLTPPLPGVFVAAQSATINVTADVDDPHGTWASGLALEALTDSTPTVINESYAYGYYSEIEHGYFTINTNSVKITISENTIPANNVLSQVYKIHSCSNKAQYATIYTQALSIVPIYVKNWTVS